MKGCYQKSQEIESFYGGEVNDNNLLGFGAVYTHRQMTILLSPSTGPKMEMHVDLSVFANVSEKMHPF